MGQNSEEAAELVATIRGEHVVMKNWYSGSSKEAAALREKHGSYPSLWKEVLNWPGWKEARKGYLKFTQGADSSSNGGEVPRKRRSRWGNASEENPSQKRRTRWGREEVPTPGRSTAPMRKPLPGLGLPGMPTNLTPEQQGDFSRFQSNLRAVNVKLDNLEKEAARVDALPRGHRERSPSPPPGKSKGSNHLYSTRIFWYSQLNLAFSSFSYVIVYGADGKRKNTRAVRWRQRLTSERQDILENLMNLNPATRQSGLFKRRHQKKIRIPIEEHPQYNFIGLIIGPRGKTQKDLESKTGCKIAIRGRGSVKEGARGRRDGKVMESDTEPLHVVVTGNDRRSVDAATDMVEQMLVVIDDEKNVHKQNQLRELALLNGTLKEDEFCQICAEKGHRSFECPKRFSMRKSGIQVKCAICGDTSHPTRDCTQKPAEQANQKEMDSAYMSFMAELDGKKVEAGKPGLPPGAPDACIPVPTTAAGSPPKLPPPPGMPPPQAGLPPGAIPPPPPQPPGQPQAGTYYGNQQHYGNQQQYPRPVSNNYYGNQQQQQQHYGNQQQQQQQQPYQQLQQPQQQNGGYQGWDYQAYYGGGSSNQSGRGGGAGGFNWWEK
jgi:splicing factor 1